MNIGMIISALPWLRRAWRLLPGPLRIPVLVVAAAVGVWYAVSGRQQLLEERAQQAGGTTRPGTGPSTDDGS